MSTEHSDSWIGSVIDGRYSVLSRIARGGMSTVYLARDERLGRDVALKVLFPHMAEDRKVVDRFEQEARNSALISHPNVVQVLDQGQTRETAYLVMEYVPGATLRTLLKKGPMTPRLALTYMDAILLGLGAAHRAGLVHRDVKPENVLVSTDGRIKIADFGLARAATHHSGTSTLMGTVAYISPELLSGDGADERADIYAIGILLYEMLTGVQPYTGDSPVRVAFQHVNSTVPAPSDAVDGLPASLDEIVRLATRSDVGYRPKNADDLLGTVRAAREALTAEELDFDGAMRQHDGGGAGAGATAVVPGGATGPERAEPATATASTSLYETRFPEDDADPATTPTPVPAESGTHATRTVPLTEDFPTREENGEWDDDVTDALGHAQWASATRTPSPPPATGSLDERDRQTVAEVPTEAFRAVDGQDAESERSAEASPPTEAISYAAPWEEPRQRTEPGAEPGEAAQETGQFSASSARYRAEPEPDSAGAARTPRGRSRAERNPKRSRQRPTTALNVLTPQRAALTVAVVMIVSALVILLAWYIGLSPSLIPSLGSPAAPAPAVFPVPGPLS